MGRAANTQRHHSLTHSTPPPVEFGVLSPAPRIPTPPAPPSRPPAREPNPGRSRAKRGRSRSGELLPPAPEPRPLEFTTKTNQKRPGPGTPRPGSHKAAPRGAFPHWPWGAAVGRSRGTQPAGAGAALCFCRGRELRPLKKMVKRKASRESSGKLAKAGHRND